MSQGETRIEAVFLRALEIQSPEERAAHLEQACAGDDVLRRRVERMLAAQPQLGSFLDRNAAEMVLTADQPGDECPGTRVGPYRLLQKIGEGGMGTVFMAEQEQPVRRRVALKVIKPGMDSAQVIARFEAERQALALMDHVNIARVLDAGATDAGRPYFVMELVHGLPITQYCDDNCLTPRERLELFVPVCQAIQHAHQKGVIHRDVKPSNVLVTMYDGQPVPKVIDFGVAKAIEQKLTERTLFTQYGAMVGTFEYMSPEQAEMSALGVDTRSDIYSLGVLLYELLTGSTPLSRTLVREVAYGEILRLIKEEEPPRPSTRLSDSGEALASISARRHMEPARLMKLVKGELDWIVMKCLEKDRNRRYETAGAFAGDVRRYLQDEPVQACPASRWYRFRKFARQHKAGLATAAVAAVVGLVAVAGLTASNVLIRQAQQLAERRAEQIRQDLENLRHADALLERGRWYASERRWDDAHAAYTKAIAIRPDHASALVDRGTLYAQLGLWDLAAADYAGEFRLRQPDTSTRWFHLALLSVSLGDREGYHQVCRRMQARLGGTPNRGFACDLMRARVLAPDPGSDPAALVELGELVAASDPKLWYHHYLLGIARYRAGQDEGAIRHLRESIALFPAYPDLPQPILAMAHHHLGQTAQAREALEAAARALDRWTHERYEKQGGEWVPHRGTTAVWPVVWWDYVECQHYYREAKQLIDGSRPPDDPRLHALRARPFAGLGWRSRAEVEYAEVLKAWPHDRQLRFEAHFNRAQSFVHLGRWRQAAGEFAQASELQPEVAYLWTYRAMALLAAGDVDAYRQTCASMVERFEKTENLETAIDVLRACVLRDDALPDTAPLLALARIAAPDWHPGTYLRGAALYRAGQSEKSVQLLEAGAKAFRPRPWDWSFLAMGHSRLGHADEARRCLAAAVSWMDEANQQELDDLTGTRPAWGAWYERVVYPLLVREAEALLRKAGQTVPAATGR